MKTIVVMGLGKSGEQKCCDRFECLCDFVEGGTYGFFVYGYYFDSYFKRNRCIVGYFTDLELAMSRLAELNAKLETEGVVL